MSPWGSSAHSTSWVLDLLLLVEIWHTPPIRSSSLLLLLGRPVSLDGWLRWPSLSFPFCILVCDLFAVLLTVFPHLCWGYQFLYYLPVWCVFFCCSFSVYNFLNDGGSRCSVVRFFWRNSFPRKINLFNWLVWKNKVLSLENLEKRCNRLPTATCVL